jgi:hypothetical protein
MALPLIPIALGTGLFVGAQIDDAIERPAPTLNDFVGPPTQKTDPLANLSWPTRILVLALAGYFATQIGQQVIKRVFK